MALLCQRDRTAMAVLVGFMACTGSSSLLATVRRAGCFLSVPLGALAGYVSYRYLSAGWWLTAVNSRGPSVPKATWWWTQ